MKRYRMLPGYFDTRALHLGTEIQEGWDQQVQDLWKEGHASIRRELAVQFGERHLDKKVQDFVDFGSLPMSVISYHTEFLRQARDAFTVGSYYPSLTSLAALGERILNYLVLDLRSDFSHTPEYKTVYNKDSFNDWSLPIEVLTKWSVLLPESEIAFRKLGALRNRVALHFNPVIDADARAPALEAAELLRIIVDKQFGTFGSQPWFIPDTPGVCFLSKQYENHVFVKRYLVPGAVLVGPRHSVELSPDGRNWRFVDDTYEDLDITDAEFVALWTQAQ